MRDRDREREREAETRAEGEAGSMHGAQRGTQSQVSRIRPWAEGDTKPLSHLGAPTFLKKLFYLFIETETERERERQRPRQREKQAPCGEPDMGLDPGSPGSRPGLKGGAKLLSHPGCPTKIF